MFVESYGQVALEGLPTSSQLRDSVDADSRRLEAAGYRSRSAYLTSPTFGAMSWLAHSTLQSGLWIDNQGTYDLLLDRDRLTLSSAFGKAGWRSVGMIPADTEPWPEGQRFYRWEALHDLTNMDYEGPRFGYGRMPDQFALESFRRLELDQPGRGPVMAEIDLESSHNPWVPLPRMVDPDELGDGSVFDGMPEEGEQRDDVWRDADLVKAAYVRSLQYSLDALTSFVERSDDDDLVLVVLGDHWPVTTVSGTTPGHDVPISVIANDPAVLRRIDAWGWQDGLRPQTGAPVWPMDAFRDRFLEAFSSLEVEPQDRPAVLALHLDAGDVVERRRGGARQAHRLAGHRLPGHHLVALAVSGERHEPVLVGVAAAVLALRIGVAARQQDLGAPAHRRERHVGLHAVVVHHVHRLRTGRRTAMRSSASPRARARRHGRPGAPPRPGPRRRWPQRRRA